MKLYANLFALPSLLLAGTNLGLENSNILSYDRAALTADYNRARLIADFQPPEQQNLTAKLIIDNESRYSSKPAGLQNETSIYRGYLQYAGEKHFFAVGRQRVPFGVGRVWNPVDAFNPIDALSVETDERRGTEAIRYEYAISDLSNLDLTVSEEKMAVRVKGFCEVADFALLGVVDNGNDRDLVGYEIQGALFDTGIELRSEGGSFHSRRTGERNTDLILGAEYGFENSLTLLGEYRLNDATGFDHGAVSLSYQVSPLLSAGFLEIINLDDLSSCALPSLEYSLQDEMTLSLGAFIYSGDGGDEFGGVADRYYLRLFVHF